MHGLGHLSRIPILPIEGFRHNLKHRSQGDLTERGKKIHVENLDRSYTVSQMSDAFKRISLRKSTNISHINQLAAPSDGDRVHEWWN